MPPSQPRLAPVSKLPAGQPSSSNAAPKPANIAPVKRHPPPSTVSVAAPALDTHFTVFVRLPFARNGFIDPAPVDWDASKDRALWKILSRASRSSDLDWKGLADNFQVSLPFLLQQAAWLYERELSQVRAQMRRVGGLSSSNAPSPTSGSSPGAAFAGGYAMRRTGSGGTGTVPRVPSTLSIRPKESPIPSTVPSTPIKASGEKFRASRWPARFS
ncbi:hypothetical protein FGG08_001980 [Glutinoglossum americanum]|uniref:Autophagy-related protein 29 n=1 Tax=Glutinoglossum americanum TaxID=1670608 RepID=A0A9P8KZQ5_9PEZI|nr:hypothetical protein FGG08_001980 [Glutinoglossum americanum]